MADTSDLDTGWGFPPRFYNNGKEVALVSEENDIKEALEILFSTSIEERLYHPAFGCDLKGFMFEPANRSLAVKIRTIIFEAIQSYESRISVNKVEITESEDKAFLLLINVEYTILSLNETDSITYSLSIF